MIITANELYPFFFSLILWAGLLGYLRRESIRHQNNLAKIPLRIHVNGTRGKSSVTRFIAAGLRGGSHRVLAKTTGSAARIIWPDGTESPLKRKGPPNIHELIDTVQLTACCNADTLVVECMALQPELQWFAENRLIQAHIGVITNIRTDHEDVMGRGINHIAAALANTIPRDGVLVTGQTSAALLRSQKLISEDSKLYAVSGTFVSKADLEGFAYPVVVENLALALAVCQLAGVDRETALAGMRLASPDCGNLTVQHYTAAGKSITLINALAANDPESTLLLWQEYMADRHTDKVILLNGRPDRRFRTVQLCRMLCSIHSGPYIAAGDKQFVARYLQQGGIDTRQIIRLAHPPGITTLLSVLSCLPGNNITVFAAGNMYNLELTLPAHPVPGGDCQCTSSSPASSSRC